MVVVMLMALVALVVLVVLVVLVLQLPGLMCRRSCWRRCLAGRRRLS